MNGGLVVLGYYFDTESEIIFKPYGNWIQGVFDMK